MPVETTVSDKFIPGIISEQELQQCIGHRSSNECPQCTSLSSSSLSRERFTRSAPADIAFLLRSTDVFTPHQPGRPLPDPRFSAELSVVSFLPSAECFSVRRRRSRRRAGDAFAKVLGRRTNIVILRSHGSKSQESSGRRCFFISSMESSEQRPFSQAFVETLLPSYSISR